MEQQRRRCTTVRQLELLMEFLEDHRDLALGRVRSKEARAVSTRLWRECAEILNLEGPARTGKEWAKVWNDQKCRIRAKLMNFNASHQATGGGPSNATDLSPLEERMANIIGVDYGPLPNVRQDHFAPNDDNSMMEVVVQDLEVDMGEALNASQQVILNINEADLRPVQTTSTPTVADLHPVENTHPPTTSQPTSPSSRVARTVRERRRAERASRQPRAQAPAQSSRTALDESRAMVLQIEKIRAEAELKNAENMQSFAESIRRIADSIERFSHMYCQQQTRAAGGTEINQ